MVIKIPVLLTAVVAMILLCTTPDLNAATLDRSNWTLSSNINDVALSNAIDDNQNSRWTTRQVQQPDQYVQIDLGSIQSVDQIFCRQHAGTFHFLKRHLQGNGQRFEATLAFMMVIVSFQISHMRC